jgi:hypothetical protein
MPRVANAGHARKSVVALQPVAVPTDPPPLVVALQSVAVPTDPPPLVVAL